MDQTFEAQVKKLLDIYEAYEPIDGAKRFDLQKVKGCIEEMAEYIISNADECADFKDWMVHHEFYTSPASTKFHGDWESGLCVHSLMVTVQALKFATAIKANFEQSAVGYELLHSPAPQINFDFTAEDVFIAAIAHDFCKASSYKIEFRNTKDISGNWVKKPMYKTKPELRNLGHGNESVLMLLETMPSIIKRRHVVEAISRHMGFSDLTDTEKMNYSNFLQNPLLVLLQLADETAAAWWDC